jgi:transcriptional regulator of acetoin/glycerol metabolism
LTNIGSEDFVAVSANGLFAQESGDLFSRLIKEGYSPFAIIENAFVLCGEDRIETDCLPKEITGGQMETVLSLAMEEASPFEQAESEVIEKTLKKYGGHRFKTAKGLGIGRTTLWRKIRKYRLT